MMLLTLNITLQYPLSLYCLSHNDAYMNMGIVKGETQIKRISRVYVSAHSSWGGGSAGTTLTIFINYNADGTVASISGSTSYQDDGTTTISASGYTY